MTRLYLSLFSLLLSFPALAQWQQTNGSEGGIVTTVERVGNQLWAGTLNGLYASYDDGKTWSISDIVPPEYNVMAIEVFDGEIFVVASPILFWTLPNLAKTMLYKSTDGGETWTTTVITDITLTQNKLFSLTKLGDALFFRMENYICFRSLDDGATWSQLAWPAAVKKVSMDHDRILVATNNAVYLSKDKGDTWTQLLSISQAEILMADSFIMALDFVNGHNYYSTDLGTTWLTITDYEAMPFGKNFFVKDSAGLMYATNFFKTVVSSDNGHTWLPTSTASIPSELLQDNGNVDFYFKDGVVSMPDFSGVHQRILGDSLGFYSNTGLRALTNANLMGTEDGTLFGFFHAFGCQGRSPNKGIDWFNLSNNDWYNDTLDFENDTIKLSPTGILYAYHDGNIKICGSYFLNNNYSIFALDDQKIYDINWNQIYSSLDGGITWDTLNTPPIQGESWVSLIAKGDSINIVDQFGDIYHTSDAGTT